MEPKYMIALGMKLWELEAGFICLDQCICGFGESAGFETWKCLAEQIVSTVRFELWLVDGVWLEVGDIER